MSKLSLTKRHADKYKLIVRCAKALITQLEGKNFDSSVNAEYNQKVSKVHDLNELLDSYLFVSEREVIGQHENVCGDVERLVPSRGMDNTIANVYGGMAIGLKENLKREFLNQDHEEQMGFLATLVDQRNALQTEVKVTDNAMDYYDSAYYRHLNTDYYESCGYTEADANKQHQFDLNYLHAGARMEKHRLDCVQNLGKVLSIVMQQNKDFGREK